MRSASSAQLGAQILQPSFWRVFSRIAGQKRLFHAYFFTGWAGVGKRAFAQQLAQTILCPNKSDFSACDSCGSCAAFFHHGHPDFLPLTGEEDGATVPVAAVRSWLQQLRLRPVSSPYKIGFIENIGRLRLEAHNALLKTMEEPPPSTIIFLIHDQGDFVPATVMSRCQIFRFPLLTAAVPDFEALSPQCTGEEKAFLSRFRQGRPFMLERHDPADVLKILRLVRSLLAAPARADRFIAARQLIDGKKTSHALLMLALNMLLFACSDLLRRQVTHRVSSLHPAALVRRLESLAALRADLLAGKKLQVQLALENIIFDPIL